MNNIHEAPTGGPMEQMTAEQNAFLSKVFRLDRSFGPDCLIRGECVVHSMTPHQVGFFKDTGVMLADASVRFDGQVSAESYAFRVLPKIKDLVPLGVPFHGLFRGGFGDFNLPLPESSLVCFALINSLVEC